MNATATESIRGIDLRHLWLELTEACNLSCNHCYATSCSRGSLHGKMVLDDWELVVDDALEAGCKSVQLIGGEPTISPFFWPLMSRLGRGGFDSVEVFTNATRIDASVIAFLESANAKVACSFYSDVPEVHDKITGHVGSFARTVAGIDRIVASDITLRVGIIEMAQNRNRMEQTIKFLTSRQVQRNQIRVDCVRSVGRASNPEVQKKTEGLCGQCTNGNLCITAAGITFPCVMSRSFPVGNIKTTSLVHILTGEALAAARSEIDAERPRDVSLCYPSCLPDNPPCSPTAGRDEDDVSPAVSCRSAGVPVAIVASDHGTDPSEADLSAHPLKTGSVRCFCVLTGCKFLK